MAGVTRKGAEQVEKLSERVRDFRREQGLTTLGALGLGVGIGAWIEKIKDVNKEFSGTQKSIAGVLSSALAFSKGTAEVDRFGQAMTVSKDITEKLEETAARFGL